MIVIRNEKDVSAVLDKSAREHIEQRIAELEPYTLEDLGTFAVVEDADNVRVVNDFYAMDVCRNQLTGHHYTDPAFYPPWEVIEDLGSFYAITWITGSDGKGFVLLVPHTCNIPELLAMCQTFAVQGGK